MSKMAGMTGPEHFLAGEHALQTAEAIDLDGGNPVQVTRHARHVTEAQAHFAAANTLAMAVMAAEADDDDVANDWAALLGIKADAE